jgi:hypothetical protein
VTVTFADPKTAVATRITWQSGDEREAACEGVIVGRALVTFRRGALTVNALIVASTDPRTLGERRAVFFDPVDGRLVALSME